MKACELILTLPSSVNLDRVEEVCATPNIKGVRINTGVKSPYSPYETLQKIKKITDAYGITLWVDLKGRQLRVQSWADTMYDYVELSRKVKIDDLPCKICFRNDESRLISYVDKNRVYLNRPLRYTVGRGQSVNILSDSLVIEGKYLTSRDIEYLKACSTLGINHVMLSFFEGIRDLEEVAMYLGKKISDINAVFKIESVKGLVAIEDITLSDSWSLMAARDDLFTELDEDYSKMEQALQTIAQKDPNAICASRIFSTLERSDRVSLSDFHDLELMFGLGYKTFMFGDNLCNFNLDIAMQAWEEFMNA